MEEIITTTNGAVQEPARPTQSGLPYDFSATDSQRPSVNVRRVLLPFDFSAHSISLLRTTAEFAHKTGATIHLLHVITETENGNSAATADRSEEAWSESTEHRLRYWARTVVAGRTPVYVTLRTGDVVDLIVARAIATRADLVIMTTSSTDHGPGPARRSLAERVGRRTHCPVLAIPEGAVRTFVRSFDGFPASPWRTILMPVDFSAAAVNALRVCSELALENSARLILANAAAGPHPAPLRYRSSAEIHLKLARWVHEHLRHLPKWQPVAWDGRHSLYNILAEAARQGADLLVLPASANDWVTRLRAASITDGVLRQANLPVLLINERLGSEA